MRKYVVIAYAITLSFRPVQAQNYAISFEGIGASDVVDSVKVENITQGTSFTVAGNDILSLNPDFLTKINTPRSDIFKSLLIYPNPSGYTTYVEFTPACRGESVIAVYDMSGKFIFRELADLDDSPQRFMISGVRKGMYLIKVTGRTYQYSGKLISINPDFNNIKIERLSLFAFRKEDNKEKASNDHKGSHDDPETSYNDGDRLKFTGYSGVYTTIVFGEPVSDSTITFDLIPCTDGDYNNYSVIKIGTQIWMAENLRTTRFNDAEEIPNITDENSWRTAATPAYSFYNNQPDNIKTYGALYNWQAASSGKICPTGWHVPDTSEISTLTSYLENQSEFTFDPGDWWLKTENDITNAFYWSLKYNPSKEYVYQADKQDGHHVKCIKDSELADTEMWNSDWMTRFRATPSGERVVVQLTTYEGSGETVHVGVVNCGKVWNGYRYWMVNTPMPPLANADDFENPSIWASADGATWVVPDGVVNPIVAAPVDLDNFNADGDIYHDEVTDKLYVVYKTNAVGGLMMTSSADGVTWSVPHQIYTKQADEIECVSPSIVKINDRFYIYYGTFTPMVYTNSKIRRISCGNVDGTYGLKEEITMPEIGGAVFWHFDVINIGGHLWMSAFAMDSAPDVDYGSHLYIMASKDGMNFYKNENAVLKGSAPHLKFYRSSIMSISGQYAIYYQTRNANDSNKRCVVKQDIDLVISGTVATPVYKLNNQ